MSENPVVNWCCELCVQLEGSVNGEADMNLAAVVSS